MSILTINLRHLYQRRGLWLAYAMFAFFVLISKAVPLDEPTAGEGTFIGLIVLAFLVGMTAAVLQIEILTKPMAFCLPGHRQVVRKFVLAVGIAANLAGASLFLWYPGLPFAWRLLVYGSAFSAGLIFYLAGAWLSFRAKQPLAYVGFLALILFGGALLRLHVLLERAVVMHPVAVMGLGLLSAVATWFYLSAPDLARHHCLRLWVGLADVFDREKLRRSQRVRNAAPWAKLKDHPRVWVQDLFIARMTACRPLSRVRFAWGAVYSSFAVPISQWSNTLLPATLMAAFLGYFGSHYLIFMASVPVMTAGMHLSHGALYSSMLTAGGRAERFTSTLAIAAAGTGLLTLFLGAVVALSVPLAAIMPDIRCYDLHATYSVISARAFYGPLVLLPVVATIYLVFYRRPVLAMIFLMTLLCGVVMAENVGRHELKSVIDVPIAVTLALFCWLAFGAVLYALSMRRCLVK